MDRNGDHRNDHHGQFEQVTYEPRLSLLDTYNGPYMYDIESMRRARDYLHSYCSRSMKPIWKQIYISTNSHRGFIGADFGAASDTFCYADIPDDDSYQYDEDRAPGTPYPTFSRDENTATSKSQLPSPPGCVNDDLNHEKYAPYSLNPDDDVFSPDVSDVSMSMKPGYPNMRLSSYSYEEVDSMIHMNDYESEADGSVCINNDRRARTASYSTSNNREALQCLYDNSQVQKRNATAGFRPYNNATFDVTVTAGNQNLVHYPTTFNKSQPFTNESNSNNNNTNMFTTPASDYRNHNRHDSSYFGCSPWHSNLHQSYGNSNYARSVANPLYGNGDITSHNFPLGQSNMQHSSYPKPSYHDNNFSHVESVSPGFRGYCNKKRSYNTAFTDLTHSKFQFNINQPCCDSNCASCFETPSSGYHGNAMSYSTTCTDFSTSQVLTNVNESYYDNNSNYGEAATNCYKKKRPYDTAFSNSPSGMLHATPNMNSYDSNNTVKYIAKPSLEHRVPYNMAYSSSQWQTSHHDDNNNNDAGYVGCPVLACNS